MPEPPEPGRPRIPIHRFPRNDSPRVGYVLFDEIPDEAMRKSLNNYIAGRSCFQDLDGRLGVWLRDYVEWATWWHGQQRNSRPMPRE